MVLPNRSKPSLDDARARVSRAGEHIAHLEREIRAVIRANSAAFSISVPPLTTGVFTDTSNRSPAVVTPPIIPILIGETVYNLKAALDYAVHELVYLDAGERQNVSYFLIEDTKAGWDSHVHYSIGGPSRGSGCWLHKLSTKHQSALYGLQPFDGCKWTADLRDLTNPDRHRFLTWVGVNPNSVRVSRNSAPKSLTMPAPGRGLPAGVEAEIGVVAFSDGAPVVETLKRLLQEVTDVISGFEPDFA